jgi:hypothetical protein
MRFDLHIRNPLRNSVWLLLRGYGEFPASMKQVTVSRSAIADSVYRWELDGSTYHHTYHDIEDVHASHFEALYIGLNADVTIHGLVVESWSPEPVVTLRFVDRIYVGRLSAPDWLGHDNAFGSYGSKGDVTLPAPYGSWEPVIHRTEDSPDCTQTELRVVCTETFGLPPPAPASSAFPNAKPWL